MVILVAKLKNVPNVGWSQSFYKNSAVNKVSNVNLNRSCQTNLMQVLQQLSLFRCPIYSKKYKSYAQKHSRPMGTFIRLTFFEISSL